MIGWARQGQVIDEAEIHDILRNERRRRTIRHLQGSLGEVSLRDLSEAVAAAETGEAPAPRDIRDSVYNSLHQTHLPKLDDNGIIEYDADRKTVRLTERSRQLDLYMEVVTPYGISWSQYYRTLGLLGLTAIVLQDLGVPVFAWVDVALWASAFLLLIAISTTYQLWTSRWFYLRQLIEP